MKKGQFFFNKLKKHFSIGVEYNRITQYRKRVIITLGVIGTLFIVYRK